MEISAAKFAELERGINHAVPKACKVQAAFTWEEGMLVFLGARLFVFKETYTQEEIADWHKLYHRLTCVPMTPIGNGHKESGKVCLNHYCCRFQLQKR